ncbi:hypothetical protein EVAR_9609_1 [Eumeta japonica]|uniref:Uncharacterized protein n=1 Tax=Eumeta variegata TaxID=151549 RepID=A0A4C1TJP1_EUMVA|nr:hypothetical protein EVAR_9609_1 [Eumeta japonica]
MRNLNEQNGSDRSGTKYRNSHTFAPKLVNNKNTKLPRQQPVSTGKRKIHLEYETEEFSFKEISSYRSMDAWSVESYRGRRVAGRRVNWHPTGGRAAPTAHLSATSMAPTRMEPPSMS